MNLIGTGWIHIESLQPLDWIESQELQLGSTVAPPLDLQEMGLPAELRAEIVEIRSCPEIQDGPGRVVVNTVNHLNPRVLELTIQDADGHTETLRPTETHKFYSATRNTWLSAVELQPGEQLSGLNGPVTLTRITPLPGTHRVYNLTVQGEHLYRVAQSGVLVHNNWCDESAKLLDDFPTLPGQSVVILDTRQGVRIVAGQYDLKDFQKAYAQGRGLKVADDMPAFHAEITAFDYAGRNGLTPTRGAINNKMCDEGLDHCFGQINAFLSGSGYRMILSECKRFFEILKIVE